jgi:hypothetical protein
MLVWAMYNRSEGVQCDRGGGGLRRRLSRSGPPAREKASKEVPERVRESIQAHLRAIKADTN